MKKVFLSLLLCFAATLAVSAKERVKVLYVGGSANIETIGVGEVDSVALAKSTKERMTDFTKFLKQHFTSVTAIDAKEYTPAMSADYDVTVFDGRPKALRPEIREYAPDGRVTRFERARYLPDDFDRASVCIASASEDIGRAIGSKCDWMCLCLEDYALGWDKDHPIFKGPFKVNIKPEMRAVSPNAKEYEPIYGDPVPDETEMWRVQTYNYGTDPGARIGMVSRPGGFTDSPETEVISGGVSAKSLDAVAIGRHGNMFHWGFAASPSQLTEAGRAALANAIAYMPQFNGKRIIARKKNESIATRREAKAQKYLVSREAWEEGNRLNEQFYHTTDSIQRAVKEKAARGEELSAAEKMYASMPPARKPDAPTYAQYVKRRQPQLYHVFGDDAAEYARFYDKNTPYMYPVDGGYSLDVDEEVRSLGIANNDIALLDKCISLLEEGGKEAALGRTVLERYTLCRFATPQEWRAWYEANKDRMFFTESGGWLWLVDTLDPSVPGNDYSVLEKAPEAEKPAAPAGTTDEKNPVALKAELTDGNVITVTMTVHDGYHTYAVLDPADPFIPTEVTVELPAGYTAVGPMITPATQPTGNATTYYVGTGAFRQKVSGSGGGEATVNVRYQCCDKDMCFPPVKRTFKVALK